MTGRPRRRTGPKAGAGVTEAGWQPQFPGQRPPLKPGHELTLRHGCYSPRKVDPRATELVAGVLANTDLAYLHADRWRPALWAWARADAQVLLISEHLVNLAGEGQLGDLDNPKVAAAYRLLEVTEARATQQRGRLGLDPLSAAKLGKDIAQGRQADLVVELTRMREEWEARQRELEGGASS